MDSLDRQDPIEAQVLAWFVSDGELAQRYVATLARQLIEERTTQREAIKKVLTDEVAAVQAEANTKIEATGDLSEKSGPCDGAIFVRSVVEEACVGGSGPLCAALALAPSDPARRFRFVGSPEAVWDFQEFRPWTDPTPIRATQTGQLDGARTIGFARVGNVVVSIAFSPIILDKTDITPEEAASYQATIDSLGFQFPHPDLALAPGLGIRATLPEPLAGEARYMLHFGNGAEGDVLWSGPSGTGAAIMETVQLGATQVARLSAGEPITFTALLGETANEEDEVFSIELTDVNQARASGALITYMAGRLGQDLAGLLRRQGG
jgi:hypothetical protein